MHILAAGRHHAPRNPAESCHHIQTMLLSDRDHIQHHLRRQSAESVAVFGQLLVFSRHAADVRRQFRPQLAASKYGDRMPFRNEVTDNLRTYEPSAPARTKMFIKRPSGHRYDIAEFVGLE
jgi:hypothetical protein